MNYPRVQAMFTRPRHNNLSIFIVNHEYYELSKRTIRAIGNYHPILKPNNFRDVQNIYQDKASIYTPLHELKYLNSTCWDKNYHPVMIDMT